MTEPEEPREPQRVCARRYTECCGDVFHCGLVFGHSGPHIALLVFEDSDCTPWPTEPTPPTPSQNRSEPR